MIRLGKLIRMTAEEVRKFRESTGVNHTPRTVEEYDRIRLLTAARLRKLAMQAGTPEEYLLNTIMADIEEKSLIDAVPKPQSARESNARWREWKRTNGKGHRTKLSLLSMQESDEPPGD
jgi:hypothetical protein